MSQWRPGQKEAILEIARKRGLVVLSPPNDPKLSAKNADYWDKQLDEKPKRKAREMNKTEAAFARLLESKVKRGELVSFDYEGMSLRWAGMTYTPDFVAVQSFLKSPHSNLDVQPYVRIVFYEVKGAHIYSRDMVRFKGARGNYPLYEFQMWQYKSREWTRLL